MDLSRFEQRLRTQRHEIVSRLTRINADLSSPRSADSEERATESENDEVLEAFGNVAMIEIKAIDAALSRLENGTFGICTKCGDPISPERLESLPYTPLCRDCVGA